MSVHDERVQPVGRDAPMSRDRYVLLPMVVYGPDTAAAVEPGECGSCGALILNEERHTEWHERMGDTLPEDHEWGP